MGQFTWKYVAAQPPQTISLYHGDTTGHVLITLNSKILIIDFKVRDTKSYSFFIEEELCEVKIRKEGGRFFYTFEINKTVQTPLNKQRKKTEKKYLLQTVAFALSCIAVIVGIALYMFKDKPNFNKITSFKQEAVAILDLSGEEKYYVYTLDGLRYENELESVPEEVNGFPLRSGDEFIVKYSKRKPEKHKFNFNKPTEKQIEFYTELAVAQQKKQAPQDSEARAACLVNVAYEMQGIPALADFYFQNKTESKDAEHNENSYKRLVRSVEFKEKSKTCLSF